VAATSCLLPKILCQINNIETLMTEKKDKVIGALKIVASSTVGNYVLPYLIGAFKHMHPSVSIDMEVCNTRHAEELIVSGGMDLGFVEGEVSNDQIATIPWLQDELMVIASPASEIAAQKTFRVPEDLERCEWVMGKTRARPDLLCNRPQGHGTRPYRGHQKGSGIERRVACLETAVCRREQGWLAGCPWRVDKTNPANHSIQEKATTNLWRSSSTTAPCSTSSQGCACLSSP
jgi:DNA-binding transcriptional LysR family regulator